MYESISGRNPLKIKIAVVSYPCFFDHVRKILHLLKYTPSESVKHEFSTTLEKLVM